MKRKNLTQSVSKLLTRFPSKLYRNLEHWCEKRVGVGFGERGDCFSWCPYYLRSWQRQTPGGEGRVLLITAYCWFARDVTAAMLVVKNKSISLLWEQNSIFMQILREKFLLFWPPTWPPCHVVANQEYGDAPPEKASGIERVAGISLAEVNERVVKSVIWSDK